jgi:hypothetical protein
MMGCFPRGKELESEDSATMGGDGESPSGIGDAPKCFSWFFGFMGGSSFEGEKNPLQPIRKSDNGDVKLIIINRSLLHSSLKRDAHDQLNPRRHHRANTRFSRENTAIITSPLSMSIDTHPHMEKSISDNITACIQIGETYRRCSFFGEG